MAIDQDYDHDHDHDRSRQLDAPDPGHSTDEMSPWQRWGELLIAAVVIVLGVVVLIQTQDIRITRAVARVSPRAIPQFVGGGLVLVGIWYVIDIMRAPHPIGGGEDAEDIDPDATTDWGVIAIIAVALVIFALLIERAGFIIASTLMFTISSMAMGSRRYVHNLVFGAILATAVFLVFDTWLGVRLPEGWLGGIV